MRSVTDNSVRTTMGGATRRRQSDDLVDELALVLWISRNNRRHGGEVGVIDVRLCTSGCAGDRVTDGGLVGAPARSP